MAKKSNRIKLHPEVLAKNGRKEFVVLPYEEYVLLQQRLDEAEDLFELREAIRKDNGEPGLGLNEMKKRLKAKHARRSGSS